MAVKARVLFREHLDWIEAQMRALGAGPEGAGPGRASSPLLSGLQGAAVLARTPRTIPGSSLYEAEMLKAWVRRLPQRLRASA